MSLKRLLRLRLATRIAKADRAASLLRLLQEIADNPHQPYEKRLESFFSDYPITDYNPVYAEVLRLVQRTFTPARQLPLHQQTALAETIFQKATNRFHLADYAARGTRYVQVSAIMDSRTTPQCRQMNGRIYAVPALSSEATNQADLVHSEDYWKNANYFRGIPTSDTVPSLPPYHYNCRTRIVPYNYDAQYADFDNMPADHKLYPKILRDKLSNYELTSQSLPSIINRANACKWRPGSLDDHYAKHNEELSSKYQSSQEYSEAAYAMLTRNDITFITTIENFDSNLQLFATYPDPNSKSKAWFLALFNLQNGFIQSYYKKDLKAIKKLFDAKEQMRIMIFNPLQKVNKMKDDSLSQCLAAMEELAPIKMYEDAVRLIQHPDQDDIYTYSDDITCFRCHTLQILADADKLTSSERSRIAKVDAYVLSHPVPPQFDELSAWLRDHPLP